MRLLKPTRPVILAVLPALAVVACAQTTGTIAGKAAGQTGNPSQDPAIAPTVAAKVRHHSTHTLPQAGPNLNVIVLDPGHGRQDLGATLAPGVLEKEVDLAFAQRLRSALTARGFSVVLTREADPVPQAPTPNPDPTLPPIPAPQPAPLTPDTRAEVANRAHPLACLLLHASSAGRGVHLYTSSLTPVNAPASSQGGEQFHPIQPWDTTQASFLPQSQRLLADLSLALRNSNLAVLSGSASVTPIDSMSCAAVAVEIAPSQVGRGSVTSPNDAGYEDRLATSLADALQTFRNEVAAQQPRPAAAAGTANVPKPAARPKRSRPQTNQTPAAGTTGVPE